ncbi:MAG: DUF4386 domain-containing protein [Reichenbachiella sp.]|uniref:DUF4386 domain-containing protein n=1 Tax=Reichenbachiella sp. TaxID=2184521 RepID=UPI002965DEE3|nr:DUF4386 domain-containing protein [Reichenbachiella sp.]MDW3209947.1 DUF4386 domain-containing protein [Reichenbachiella sp.]
MTPRTLSKLTGASYLIIFFAAIFANFFVLEAILQDPIGTIQQDHQTVRFGIMAFMITVVFDVVVAWTLSELFKDHPLTKLSTYFRMMHAAIMGVAIFALPLTLGMTSSEAILGQIDIFNTIWLIGLFFFGIHLLLLSVILQRPKWIAIFLALAGLMYMVDTSAHFLLANYDDYADIFLALVAIPSIVGEMSLAIWLLFKGEKHQIPN